jgi:hypothetical protein
LSFKSELQEIFCPRVPPRKCQPSLRCKVLKRPLRESLAKIPWPFCTAFCTNLLKTSERKMRAPYSIAKTKAARNKGGFKIE